MFCCPSSFFCTSVDWLQRFFEAADASLADAFVGQGPLAAFEIGYEHIAALGGLRSRARDVPPGVNAFWENQSFHNYADYAMGESFHAGFARLCELGDEHRCVVMCAETLWWRCHRRIITDYLLAAGEQVFHILGPAKVEPARMTSAARPGPSLVLTYPAAS